MLAARGMFGALKPPGLSISPSGDVTGAADFANITAAMTLAAAAPNGGTLYLRPGSYYINAALVLPNALRMVGDGDPGYGFEVQLITVNCRAFTASGIHQTSVENITVYTSGSSPPANLLYVTNSYSLLFKDVALYVSSLASCPTSEAVLQDATGGGCNDITYQHVTVRTHSAGTTNITYGFRFANGCGEAAMMVPDIECCNRCVQWEGGRITMISPHIEQANVYGLFCNPNSDSIAAMTIIGGQCPGPFSGVGIGISAGTKNLRVINTRIFGTNNQDIAIVDVTNVSNVHLDHWPMDTSRISGMTNIGPIRLPDSTVHAAGNTGAAPQPFAGLTQTWTLSANATWAAPTTAGFIGQRIRLMITASGAFTTAWNAVYRNAPAWAAAANGQKAVAEFVWNGTSWQFVGGSSAFA